jgi:pyrimidine-specific ribonucleoside hydrolase
MSKPVIIDCDPGHDDAVALLLAAQSDEIDLRAVTTVAGNQTLEKTTNNALRVLTLADRTDVPVAAGCEEPLVREFVSEHDVHGDSGLEGPDLDDPAFDTVDRHGVDLIIETVRESEDPVSLVPVGPLTNVAMAIRKAPDIVDDIERVVLMGGAFAEGNKTPVAEFNIYADAEAAGIVFDADVDRTMIGLDVTRKARYDAAEFDEIRAIGSDVAVAVAELFEFYLNFHNDTFGWDSVPIHDACAVAEVIDPGIVESEHMRVEIETEGEHTYGQTVCDRQDVWERTGHDATPNTDVGLDIDRDAFFELLLGELERY